MVDFESGYNWKDLTTYRHYVGEECWHLGNHKELEFGMLIREIYDDVRPATKQEQYKHIDWVCSVGTIDVKAMKSVRRHTPRDATKIWVEFKNSMGNKGWLYGEQDFVAFEQPKCYIMVRRPALEKLSESLCDTEKKVDTPNHALYKGYNRKNSRDLISLIKTSDLLELQNRKIYKNKK